MTLNLADFEHFVFDTLELAHAREPMVGGLFNSYEKTLHYELYTAALRLGLWDTVQEARYPYSRKACDLKFPLADGSWAWLEVKMWWFLHEAYDLPYSMISKARTWPAADWRRLKSLPQGHHRALLLLRTWDGGPNAYDLANRWLHSLAGSMGDAGEPRTVELKSQAYHGNRPHSRYGQMHLWSSAGAGSQGNELVVQDGQNR